MILVKYIYFFFLYLILYSPTLHAQTAGSGFTLVQEIEVGNLSTGGINDVLTGIDLDGDGNDEIVIQIGHSTNSKTINYEWDGASVAAANENFYPYCTSIENSGSNPSNWSTSDFSVSTTSPNTGSYSYRANAGLSYDYIFLPSFNLSNVTSGNGKMVFWVRITSSAYNDFGEITVYADLGDDGVYETEVQTYSDNSSFLSGSYTKIEITLPDDILGQYNVRFRFAFKRSTVNGGNWNFDDFSIINKSSSVLFINEIDYDDPGADDEEFVEICGLAGNYNNVTIKLINGLNGSVYGTVELGNISLSNESEGYGFYVWAPTNTTDSEVDASTNGSGASSIQNGAPDGIQIDVDGVIVDAVSYENGGTAMNDADGNTMEQTNFDGSSENDANTTLGRQGLDGSSWELQIRTIGTKNTLSSGGTQNYGQVISGTSGFRMMSSPVSGAIYSDLLSELWTQGMTGADVENGTANVWIFNVSEQIWTVLPNLSTASLTAGEGFLVYVYSDTDYDGDDDLPVTLSVTGTVNSSSATVPSSGSIADNAWVLAGNPYASTIDWDLVTQTNVTASAYVWDNSTSAYKSWNGSGGGLIDGLIAPYQGFWVQGTGGTGSITIETGDKSSTAGTFYKQMADSTGSMIFTITAGDYSDQAFVSFMTNGESGIDIADAYKLLPMTPSERVIGLSYAEGSGLAINNLPYVYDGTISIPLDIMYLSLDENYNFVTQEQEVTMSWDLNNLPVHVSMTLTDNITGNMIDLTRDSEYTFTTEDKGSCPAYGSAGVNLSTQIDERHSTLTICYRA